MNRKLFKPLYMISLFFLVVSLACNFGSTPTAAPTQPPSPTQAPPPTEKPVEAPTEKPVSLPPKTESGAVNTLDGVESAVIQIEADGTFVDPEVGWQVNMGKLGSGFIIDPSGIAVTNNHVVTGAALLKVWVGGSDKPRNAKVLGVSECSDLAIIKIDGDKFPYLEWYDGQIKVGLKVFAAGYPLGDPNFTLTDGIVSKSAASGETTWASVDSVIEHSAKINPGNSGGPLVNEEGKIIGINYATVSATDQNFAIGRDEALKVIDQLKAGKDVDSIGVNGGAVYGTVNDIPISGVWVRSVASGSPADKALILPGDIIYQLEGQVLATDGTMADYCDILRSRNSSDTMGLTVIRFSNLSLMEGQLNGRELAATGYFGQDSASATATAEPGNYVNIQDETSTIEMEIPAEWSEIDNRTVDFSWGDIDFTAPSIIASTNLNDFSNYNAPGVRFIASDRMGEIGGYVQLLDGWESFNYDPIGCKRQSDLWRQSYGEGTYYDPYYEGMFDVWDNCNNTDFQVLILTARPKSNPTAYLMMVEIVFKTEKDLDFLYHILDTFQVIGNF